MSVDEQIARSYEDVRLADLGACGAEQYLAIALRDRDIARAKLETLLKASPNRMENL
jgi:hypothetical protein